jgi:hypothetical protein
MTSLASLTHATAAPAFNGLFYATAATIIPVFFLAITVQARGHENLLTNLASQYERLKSDKPDKSSPKGCIALIVFIALWVAAIGMLLYGIGGEILAIYALYQRQAESSTGSSVFTGVILMFSLTAAGPAFTFLRWLFDAVLADDKVPPQHPPDWLSDDKDKPETGKADPA